MGAGPASAPPRVLHAAARPLVGHLHPETIRVMDDIKEGLQYAFQTTNPVTLCLSCAGHGGMEAALSNLLEPGDVAVVAVSGYWGARASDMVTRQGSRVVRLEVPLGQPLSLEAAEKAVSTHRPRLLFMTQAETTTSLLQPLEGFGPMCHKYGTLLVVDAVASTGGTPLWTDRWELDVVYSASQKGLNALPGLAPITFSPRAMKRIRSRQTPCPVYYWDILKLADYWGCFGNPRVYHHTGPVSLFFSLREALAILAAEGLSASWRRHEEAALRLHAALERLGAELFVTDASLRVPTITAFALPDRDLAAVLRTAMCRHELELSPGIGPTAGRVLRVGLMGSNANAGAVDHVISVLEDCIKHPIT